MALPHLRASRLARAVTAAQDHLLRLLGSAPTDRATLVAAILRRDAREATAYWLQLVVAVGIATLGLVVGSTAVVIGAMLVAPLMGPIIGLAMGLAAGSPFLVLRAAGRILLSVAVAVGGAALITGLLPFHELNSEIAARTSPTLLDLVTAGFCALAGAYAALRPGSETATTAAGTSIGISLVPPLCASGYGVGTAATGVATGAALLFLTNLVAIIVVGTVAFVAAGFNRVDVAALERAELAPDVTGAPIARAVTRRLARFFDSRWGPALRLVMPFVLLAALYVPLRQALDEVAWEVRVRAAVRAALADEPRQVVQSRVRIERHQVDVAVVVMGSTADAADARARLDTAIRHTARVAPHLEVLAVADATAVAGLESSLLAARPAEPPPAPPPSPAAQRDAARRQVRADLAAAWPSDIAGRALALDLGEDDAPALRVRIVHLGPPLSLDAHQALQQLASAAAARPATLIDVAVEAEPLTRTNGDTAFVTEVALGVRETAALAEVAVCVQRPAAVRRPRAAAAAAAALAAQLESLLVSHPRVVVTPGPAWEVRFVDGSCPLAPT